MNKFRRILPLTLAVALLAGCAREMEPVEAGESQEDVVVTLTTRVSLGNTSTKAVNGDGEKTFAVGDQIAVVYTNSSTATVKATSQALTAGDIANSGKSAQFTVSLTNPVDGTVRYVYPASMVDDSGVMTSLASQNGTLAGLQAFDYAEGSGTMTSTALPAIDLTNQIAVGKFTLKDYTGTTDLTGITSLTVYSDGQSYTITPASTLSDTVYVAMKPITDKAVSFKASDGTNTYWKLVPSATLEASNFYPINVTMGYPGVLPGQFKVSSTKKVFFSQGNLQASTVDYGHNWSWHFADRQYDYDKSSLYYLNQNATVSQPESCTIDLYGWSTASTYYGLSGSTQEGNFTGDFVDWGGLMGSGWYTLTSAEWDYLRSHHYRAMASISIGSDTYHGFVFLPDSWTLPEGCTFTHGVFDAWDTNSYSEAQWELMELSGAVFLPMVGTRSGLNVYYRGERAGYWSSSNSGTYSASCLSIQLNNGSVVSSSIKYAGNSVRLVLGTTSTPPAGPWDGTSTVPLTVIDSDTYGIYTPAQLAEFAAEVNGGTSFAGKTVKLMSDIDLNNQAWTPIGHSQDAFTSSTSLGFKGTFDGNGKTISNLKVDTRNNSSNSYAGLFGAIVSCFDANEQMSVVIKDLTIDGFDVKSNHEAGAIVGDAFCGGLNGNNHITITGCTVKNGTVQSDPVVKTGDVKDDANQVGGLAGILNWIPASVTNNTVNNVTIVGYRDLGGVLGFANGANQDTYNEAYLVVFTGNTVTGTTITQVDAGYETTEWKVYETVHEFVGRMTASQTYCQTAWPINDSNTFSGTINRLPKTLNLSTVTEDTVIPDGSVVTGTLGVNKKISIAAGATVTLDGVSINADGTFTTGNYAGITCLGDATIVLKEGSTNFVKGFYEDYPGIYVPVGSTLIIQGPGTLNASSNGYSAGIGAGGESFDNDEIEKACGSIEIQGGIINATGSDVGAGIGGGRSFCGTITISGGTVTAIGGENAAGIGGGEQSSCGDIFISGGTVTATGGQNGAGIGSGNSDSKSASCGDITISGSETQVTATKGSDAPNSIGRGSGAGCGTVTIGGTVYYQNNAYVGGGASYLPVSPLVYPTPMTMEALTDGTIVVSSPKSGMKYSKNGGEKQAVTTDPINVSAGDKVAFYGNGTSVTSYYGTRIYGGTANVKVYGNIMSLVNENNFVTATSVGQNAFRDLFWGNDHILDASGLLLPATSLMDYCYEGMFRVCSNMTAAPAELPATSLSWDCYKEMFSNCDNLITAPELRAQTLVKGCYHGMFNSCDKLSSVTCLATSISASVCIDGWLSDITTSGTLYVDASMTGANWNVPSTWTVKSVAEKP